MKLMIIWIFLLEEEYFHSHHRYLEGSLLNHQILHKSFLGKNLSFFIKDFLEFLRDFYYYEHGLELLLFEKKL